MKDGPAAGAARQRLGQRRGVPFEREVEVDVRLSEQQIADGAADEEERRPGAAGRLDG